MATPAAKTELEPPQPEQKPKTGWAANVAKAKQKAQQHYRATKALAAVMRAAWNNQEELRILVTGKTGQGKSALINGILGATVAVEGARATRCTTEVEMFSETIEGVPIKVFDSPGLQDRTDNEGEYIRGMRDQCQELSLVLYCTKMINTRLTDADKNAMIKLTAAFGESFWDYAVFVLTFANKEDVSRQDERDQDEDEPDDDDEEAWKQLEKRRFEGRLEIWKEDLREFLKTEVKVSAHIAENIPVVPTGDRKVTRINKEPLRLPDRDNWFTKYWEVCCLRVKDTRLFMKVNSSRIVSDDSDETKHDDDDDTSEDDMVESSQLEGFETAMNNYVEVEVRQLPDSKIQDSKSHSFTSPADLEGEVSGTDIIVSSASRRVTIKSRTSPQPLGDAKEKKNLIIDQSIHIHPELVKDVTAETLRRAGFDESMVKVTKGVIEKMKKPADWFIELFRMKKNETGLLNTLPAVVEAATS